jgi:hypothetical protein
MCNNGKKTYEIKIQICERGRKTFKIGNKVQVIKKLSEAKIIRKLSQLNKVIKQINRMKNCKSK